MYNRRSSSWSSLCSWLSISLVVVNFSTLHRLVPFHTNGRGPAPLPCGQEYQQEIQKRPFSLSLHILTWRRAKPLARLLTSLTQADYEGDTVSLVFHIDGNCSEDVLRTAQNFKFVAGTTKIVRKKTNEGLGQAWFDAWEPNCVEQPESWGGLAPSGSSGVAVLRTIAERLGDFLGFSSSRSRQPPEEYSPAPRFDCDFALILEDDTSVSPLFYRWLKRVWTQYYFTVSDLAGVSLQRQMLIPFREAEQRAFHIKNNHDPFLFKMVGTIGFSPHPRVWAGFRKWILRTNWKKEDVAIPHLVTTDWWRTFEKVWDHNNQVIMGEGNSLGQGGGTL